MSIEERILKLARETGFIKAEDLISLGIHRNHLYILHKKGFLEKVAAGLYRLSERTDSEFYSLILTAKVMPSSVVCLLSALNFHGITSQLPHKVWISLLRGSVIPRIKYPSFAITYLSEPSYSHGIEDYTIDGVKLKVYSPAKTVADCFKFRSKVGLDIAIESLKETLNSEKASVDEIMDAAEKDRVSRVIRPYIEAIV